MLQLLYLLIFLNITYTSAVLHPVSRAVIVEHPHQPEKANNSFEKQHDEKTEDVQHPFIKSKLHIPKDDKLTTKANVTVKPTIFSKNNVNATTNADNKVLHTPENIVQSGALLRGFYVLLGITFLFVIYLGFRMYRTGKGNKPPVRVRKYGVLANRGDVEMLPLPLSEDEDDDTVFELNNHINR